MKQVIFVPVILGVSFLTGCATITNGRFQQVTVQTQPPGAHCSLINNKGQWSIPETPATVNVHRSINDLKVTCGKDGYQTTYLSIPSQMKKMIAGNVLFGGAIGAGVDASDGAGFSYPNVINVSMQPSLQHVTTHVKKKIKALVKPAEHK